MHKIWETGNLQGLWWCWWRMLMEADIYLWQCRSCPETLVKQANTCINTTAECRDVQVKEIRINAQISTDDFHHLSWKWISDITIKQKVKLKGILVVPVAFYRLSLYLIFWLSVVLESLRSLQNYVTYIICWCVTLPTSAFTTVGKAPDLVLYKLVILPCIRAISLLIFIILL